MYVFESQQSHFTTNPAKGQPYGVMNRVSIRNGKGVKVHARLGKQGTPIQSTRHTLTNKEKAAIQNRQFIPKLWRCCSRKTRRNQRR